ncbi:MAG: NADPH-dependent oxidoreductase, partial [Enterococcus casseliflavus]
MATIKHQFENFLKTFFLFPFLFFCYTKEERNLYVTGGKTMDLFDTFTRHSSVRDFQPRPLSKELKQKLVTVAQSGSSSNFVQAYSIIEV